MRQVVTIPNEATVPLKVCSGPALRAGRCVSLPRRAAVSRDRNLRVLYWRASARGPVYLETGIAPGDTREVLCGFVFISNRGHSSTLWNVSLVFWENKAVMGGFFKWPSGHWNSKGYRGKNLSYKSKKNKSTSVKKVVLLFSYHGSTGTMWVLPYEKVLDNRETSLNCIKTRPILCLPQNTPFYFIGVVKTRALSPPSLSIYSCLTLACMCNQPSISAT